MTSQRGGHLLRVHIGENDRYGDRPLYEEILRRCQSAGARLAIVYRGVEGYGASTLIHRPGWFGRSSDAPIVVTVAAQDDVWPRLRPLLEDIVEEGLLAISTVEMIQYQED